MKNLKTIALVFITLFTGLTTFAQNKKINLETSQIDWVGRKVTGAHTGTLKFNTGILVLDGKKLKGGSFEVDMNSIIVTDLEAGKGKERLEGHLKNEDFFGTDKHPSALLDFKTIADKGDGNYTVTADLTIKNITHPVTFDIGVTENRARTSFKVDRTKYDIKYRSGSIFDNLGDKAINDEFELTVVLYY